MALIRPRLTDFHNIGLAQKDADFAIPFLDEDIPLYIDPFLLWKSPSLQDQSLHTAVLNSFNHLGYLVANGHWTEAQLILIAASECPEIGLGHSKSRQGHRIGETAARSVLQLFEDHPVARVRGFAHFEEIQFYVEGIGPDRISDLTATFLKSFLIDYTIAQCTKLAIPLQAVRLADVYDYQRNALVEEAVSLPVNPDTGRPLLLTPKRWLRRVPWINPDEFFSDYVPSEVKSGSGKTNARVQVLTFNRANYGAVGGFIAAKERQQKDCQNDPLFVQIPVLSAKRKMSSISKLPTGKAEKADRLYEDLLAQLLASLFYPPLDFAKEQSRTDSGVLIRDLVFYNTQSEPFLREIRQEYGCKQLVVEMKNVWQIDRDHINQLNRYLADPFGAFGVLVTRNPLPRPMFRNTIDLWSGQRRCILTLTDEDIDLMVQLFESRQRNPIDVLKRNYVEFRRTCPS